MTEEKLRFDMLSYMVATETFHNLRVLTFWVSPKKHFDILVANYPRILEAYLNIFCENGR